MINLQQLPAEVLNLWNKWEIRGVVILSLLLQIILILLGSWRKCIVRSWVHVLVWSAYLSADVVATTALGLLARGQGNNIIQAFWVPFLLLHLGGPDAITAYAIEDNELWLRHLLGLVYQVGMAFCVFSRSWGSGILTFIAIPMFLVGIVKYGERTWVLRSSCSENLKDSTISSKFWDQISHSDSFEMPLQGNYLAQAYSLSHISMSVMQDLVIISRAQWYSQMIFSPKSAEHAFRVVELELGLIYDKLYTKAPLIYSSVGIILRCISISFTLTTFVVFAVLIDAKHAHSIVDISITYLLLIGAIVLEMYAFFCLIFSDWTMIWWTGEGRNCPTSPIGLATYYLKGQLTSSKRWSRSIGQCNIISSCTENNPLKWLELFGISEEMMRKQMYVNLKDKKYVVDLIFKHLQEKGKMIEERSLTQGKVRSEILAQRGDGVPKRMGRSDHFKWCTTEIQYNRSLLVWHLATDICYHAEDAIPDCSEHRETSKCLSEYMMYLFVLKPNMLPKGVGDIKSYGYGETCKFISNLKQIDENIGKAWRKKDFVDELVRTGRLDMGHEPTTFEHRKAAVFSGSRLAVELLVISESAARWKMINEVWIEMLAYAASHCPWKEQAQELRRGGELLTHVCLLMLHFGLSRQYEDDQFVTTYRKANV